MNKAQLIYAVAAKAGVTAKTGEAVLNATLACIEDALKKNDKVVLVGFGTFEVRDRAARQGRNPQASEIQIPAAKVPVFKVSKALRDAVN